ncbi:MAG: hypothetical protein IT368_17680, partial [Candidatus Hydrogenedentes bacterium]|nr:hypothetical protein [Candidatus Hydrogenedentota bacterium]
ITFTLPRGGEGMCHFLNTCHMGIGSEISHLVNINTKAFGGFPSFFWATVTTLGTFSPKFMRISIDDLYVEQDVVDFIVCNGQYDGGGMHVAPKSKLDDGLFDIYLIGRVAPADAILNLPKLYRGKLTKRPDVVKYFRGRTIRVESTDIVRIAPDGENPGYLPATIQIVPRILKLIAGWSSREKVEAASPVPATHPAAAAAH